MQFLSLYLHIPFCRTRCSYCAFNTYTDRFDIVAAYVEALGREIAWLGQGQPVHTVYFGGGTPSLLSPAQLADIMAALRQHFDLLSDAEITLEANPGTVNQEYLAALRALGINRLSLGMQSAVAGELALFQRDHNRDDVAVAVEVARAAGFDNFSLDLIYGIPGQSLANWQETLHFALQLQAPHLSAYALSLEPGTDLARQVQYGRLPSPDDDLAADMYELATLRLGEAGMVQYEISNWALPGQAARHNLQYWRNLPYLGLGAGAHGYAAGQRTINIMRPEQYIERLQAQSVALDYPRTAATQRSERVDSAQERFETIMLGLRLLQEGFSLSSYAARFGESFSARYERPLRRLLQQGLLCQEGDNLRLHPQARLISNRVFEAFIE